MGTKITRSGLLAGAIALLLGAATPVLAQGHGGGGGGGHGGGGGGHGGGGGGGHASGGGHAYGGAHYGGGGHAYSQGYYGGVRGFYGGGAHGYAGVQHVSPGYRAGGAVRGAYGYGGNWHGGYWRGGYWNGGYWHGGWWPRAYYGPGFAWFLPILPLAYATYWWGGIPYYYANDVYYTWSPAYDGYVVSDPPPVADANADGSGSGVADIGGQVFMYPKNGQTADQQSVDRRECQEWAASQAGASQTADYRRAMVACVEGRGYAAK